MKVPIPTAPKSMRNPSVRKKGQTLVEYALILGVMSVIAVAAYTFLGSRIETIFSEVSLLLDTAQSST